MKKLRTKGTVAAAIVASAAMLLSTFAIAPANAADGTCAASDQDTFNTCITSGASNITVNKTIKFNAGKALIDLGLAFGGETDLADSYGTPVEYTLDHSVTITGEGSSAILRNVIFTVPQNQTLTLAGTIVLDDINLTGTNLLGLLGLQGLLNLVGGVKGIPTAINVAGGTLNLEDTAHVAAGAKNALNQQRAIAVTAGQSIVNLNSSGEYKRSEQAGLDIQVLPGLSDSNLIVKALNDLLGALTIKRTAAYPTVWGRDAAVYSEPGVTDATINITNGIYSNQKDKEVLGKTYLNGAVSSSATVNITGGNNVKISSVKIGNGVDKNHNGSNTTGTLNLDNPKAQLDQVVENDTDAQAASTDSWALELRSSATANITAGSINDTLHTNSPKVIESEAGSKINILAGGTEAGDVKIANQSYWIREAQKSGAKFAAKVNANASVAGEDTSSYELWSSGAAKTDNTLAQLAALVKAETAGSTPAAAKLSQSTYSSENGLSAAYLEDVNADGRAVYGRHVITASGSPFEAVKNSTAGTVTLYGLPWVGKYSTDGDAPTQTSKLFAGWYTSQSAFEKEDALQASTSDERHHNWNPSDETFDGTYGQTVVVSTDKYTGSLYPHFVSDETIKVTGVQVAPGTKTGRYNLRFISGVDSYNFKSVNFHVEYAGRTLGDITSTGIYDYVVAGNANKLFPKNPYVGYEGYEQLPEQGDARYVTTGVINNMPGGVTLDITPSWTTLDGVTVSGSTYQVTLQKDGTIA
ncbi:hypothetical protein JS528_07440 [Bifidobacterium sp. MA2]|uniref:Cell surface protein n=1 Tax=Bifidobacterium santillanense TaxID=2809028 RepID=A0ABS5UQP2_9BIFI|nr:hypothetical protein [Bifidobacterium santillanense]MBT1173186.1 hypothetical protein [Bifidobacterium santillanense]